MAAHALLSASGSSRWLACPPSAKLGEQFEETTSTYAEEGSLAHAFAELELAKALKLIKTREYNKQLKEIKASELYLPEMDDYVQEYVTLVMERISKAKADFQGVTCLLEQRLDYSRWVPEGFGTGDAVLIYPGTVEVIDFKYGKGVAVDAEHNPQMMLYGLGAYEQYNILYDVEIVRMTIMQPRLDSVSMFELSAVELVRWAEETVKPTAEKAFAGQGDFKAGDHCRFCPAKATCRTRAEANLELAKYDFAEPPTLSKDEIGDILAKAEELQKWAADVQAFALDKAVNHGVKFPGFKLVEGRSNRKYVDDAAVTEALLAEGYEVEAIHKPKELLGITAMERFLGKKKFNTILGDLVIKPEGRPTLVAESDKRPEINSVAAAQDDFED